MRERLSGIKCAKEYDEYLQKCMSIYTIPSSTSLLSVAIRMPTVVARRNNL